jgi:hypothetical protein
MSEESRLENSPFHNRHKQETSPAGSGNDGSNTQTCLLLARLDHKGARLKRAVELVGHKPSTNWGNLSFARHPAIISRAWRTDGSLP